MEKYPIRELKKLQLGLWESFIILKFAAENTKSILSTFKNFTLIKFQIPDNDLKKNYHAHLIF